MSMFGQSWKEENTDFQEEYRAITGDDSILSKEEMKKRLERLIFEGGETLGCIARANNLASEIENSEKENL